MYEEPAKSKNREKIGRICGIIILRNTDYGKDYRKMLVSPYRTPAIVPPAEHPRLMLRSSDLPRIRKNLSLPENAFAAGVC